MKNPLTWFLVLVVVLGLWWAYKEKNGAPSGTIKIGSILPLTGPFPEVGEEIHRGVLLAVEKQKAMGETIEYISEDDAFDSKLSVGAASKLLNIDKVDAVFVAWAETAKPTLKLFSEAQKPLLVLWDSNNDLKRGGSYVFSIGFSSEKSGEVMAQFAYEKLGLRKVAMVSVIDPVMKIWKDNFKLTFTAKGGSIVFEEEIPFDSKENRSVAAKLKTTNFDGLYAPLLPPQHSLLFKQLRQFEYKGVIMAGDSFIQSEVDASGEAAENVYLTNIYSDKADEISAKYKDKYKTDPIDPALVSFGYDGINFLVEAGKIARKNNLTLRDAMTKVKLDGAGGPMDMNGGQFSERVEKLYQVKNGKPVEVKL